MNNGFLSCVQSKRSGDEDAVMVRARAYEHLEEFSAFAHAEIEQTPQHDYHFRVHATRKVFAAFVASKIETITYENFKASVRDHALHAAYTSVWNVMYDYALAQAESEMRVRLGYRDKVGELSVDESSSVAAKIREYGSTDLIRLLADMRDTTGLNQGVIDEANMRLKQLGRTYTLSFDSEVGFVVNLSMPECDRWPEFDPDCDPECDPECEQC